MNKLGLFFCFLLCPAAACAAYDFENTTCSSDETVVSSISIGKVEVLSPREALKKGVLQPNKTGEYVSVTFYLGNGAVNRSLYSVVDGVLYQSFPSLGETIFRRILPPREGEPGQTDQVSIKGSSLESYLGGIIRCEKNLY